MSTTPQAAMVAGQAEVCLEPTVRNLDVIDFLANRCRWCGEYIFDSATKPRRFCNNNNVCCNKFSRHGGVTKAVWDSQHLARINAKKPVLDHPAFELVERPLRYEPRDFFKDGLKMFRHSASPSAKVRIPKFGGGLQKNSDGVSITTKRTQPDLVNINDRPGVSGDGRYSQPVNPFPPEEKMIRVIFSKRLKK
jgi:hypothetical protein